MQRPITTLLFIASLLAHSTCLHAATQPKFSIIPEADAVTSFLLPSNFTETVRYQVTNQTKITRTLTMVPIAGVSQTLTGTGVCANPFTLAPQQTCTLILVINGSQVPASGIDSGPVVCKTKAPGNPLPDPFLCSQPSAANTLAVSVTTTGQHAYVANQLGNSVSFCQVNPATGFLSQCGETSTGAMTTPEGVGLNPAGTLLYTANPGNNTISVCQVNQATGAVSACINAGGSGFALPNAIAFSPDGSILYTANLGPVPASVSACLVNVTTGMLSDCVKSLSATFADSADMAVNAAGTLAYVANRGASTISVCRVSGQTVDACDDSSGSLFNGPEGIILSPAGLHAYIANAGDKKVIVCDVRQDTGLLENCAATHGQFDGSGNVALNNLGSHAYVPNELASEVFVCDVRQDTGHLSDCKRSRGTGFVGPTGIALR